MFSKLHDGVVGLPIVVCGLYDDATGASMGSRPTLGCLGLRVL